MRRFLFEYFQLFSYIGDGTPENPGGDFHMSCWIEAPDEESALKWGAVVLGDYEKAHFARSENLNLNDGSPIEGGGIVCDVKRIADAELSNFPSCRVGEIPIWLEPWRNSNARRKNA